MRGRKNSRFQWWKLILLLSLMGGCASLNPAAPPAPPAEIPSLLVFPESVATDLSKISPDGEAALVVDKGQETENFLDAIHVGVDAIDLLNSFIEGALQPLNSFEIPVRTTIRTFEGREEIEEGEGIPRTFKIDFADYDFDGDGETERCTGCTCPTDCSLPSCPSEIPVSDLRPVCFRIWVQESPEKGFEQHMAGLFEILPTEDDPETEDNEENPGKGRFRFGNIGTTTLGSETGEDTSVETRFAGIIYDHNNPLNPLNKSTEGFFIQKVIDEEGTLLLSNNLHGQAADLERIDLADESYLEKTARVHFESFQKAGTEGLEEDAHALQEYIGRFRDDKNFWSGSVLIDALEADFNIPTTCARITDGVGVPQDICIDLGIDTSDEDVTKGQTIRKAEDSDVSFPADFPEEPTF